MDRNMFESSSITGRYRGSSHRRIRRVSEQIDRQDLLRETEAQLSSGIRAGRRDSADRQDCQELRERSRAQGCGGQKTDAPKSILRHDLGWAWVMWRLVLPSVSRRSLRRTVSVNLKAVNRDLRTQKANGYIR